MDATSRRRRILDAINKSTSPISAAALAKSLNVSRQVIVGDVALLRAGGHDIIATARGYRLFTFKETNQYKIVCQHPPEATRDELYVIVDQNAEVLNVCVEHEVYGEITGNLNLSTRKDVDIFMDRVENSEVKLLSELTMGIHLHTISCADKTHFDRVYDALASAGYLLGG